MFKKLKKLSYYDVPHSFDKSGKSKQDQTGFLFKNHNEKDHVRIECTYWSKKMKKENYFKDSLGVSASSTELLQWISSGYN